MTLDQILSTLETVAEVAELYPPATGPAFLADKLLRVAQAANRAHVAATGTPIDPKLLTQEALV